MYIYIYINKKVEEKLILLIILVSLFTFLCLSEKYKKMINKANNLNI